MNACIRSHHLHKGIKTQCHNLMRFLSVGRAVQQSEEREYRSATGHGRSVKDVIKDELFPVLDKETMSIETPIPRHSDFLIIGGGLVGTSVAYFLKTYSSAVGDVTIIERDYTGSFFSAPSPVLCSENHRIRYTRASSMLSAGGIRHQFSVPENVQMSMFTSEFLKHYKHHLSVYEQDPPEVTFHHQGYLFLAPLDKADMLEEAVKMQRSYGARTVMLSRNQLEEKYPWLNLDGIEVGSLGTAGEGWFDPWQLVHSLKAKNVANGVRYCEGEVVKFRTESKRGSGYGEDRNAIVGVDIDCKDGKRYGCDIAYVVNCAGPWAGEIANLAGIGAGEEGNIWPLPVEPRKRFVYTFHCPDGPTLDTPFLVDPSGTYFRREGLGGHYICGASPPEEDEPNIADLNVDYDFFDEVIWPRLAHRVPAFNKLKLKAAWAGYYDYNFIDQNLIIGPHPYHSNFIFANGMSGHGVQHALAIGQAIFELILHHDYKTIDLKRFGFDRIIDDKPIHESAIV